MTYKNLENDDLKYLIDSAFEKAKIKGKGINNCKKLSQDIEHITGHNISAATIYRLLNIKKYKIRPYEFTIESIDEYIRGKEYQRSRKNYFNYAEHNTDISNKPLKDLLRFSLEDHNLDSIEKFLDTLPSSYGALGFKQLDIALVFGTFFRKHQNDKESIQMLNTLAQHSNFTTYYFESFPDFDHSSSFYLEALIKNIETFKYANYLKKASRKQNIQKDDKLRQAIYCISISINIAYHDSKFDFIKSIGHGIFDYLKIRHKLLDISTHIFKLHTRFISAYIHFIKATEAKPDDKITTTLTHWLSLFKNSAETDFQKIFSAVIIADTLISVGMSLQPLQLIFNDKALILVAKQEFEPTHTRFLEYAKLEAGMKFKPQHNKDKQNYKCGFYELNHHHKMLEMANLVYSL